MTVTGSAWLSATTPLPNCRQQADDEFAQASHATHQQCSSILGGCLPVPVRCLPSIWQCPSPAPRRCGRCLCIGSGTSVRVQQQVHTTAAAIKRRLPTLQLASTTGNSAHSGTGRREGHHKHTCCNALDSKQVGDVSSRHRLERNIKICLSKLLLVVGPPFPPSPKGFWQDKPAACQTQHLMLVC